MTIIRSIYGAEFSLAFDLNPKAGEWKTTTGDKTTPQSSYTSNGYVLEIQEEPRESSTLILFNLKRDDGQMFTVKKYVLSARSPIGDLHRLWIPHYTERHIMFQYMQRQLPMDRLSPSSRYPLVDTRSCADSRSPIVLGINRLGYVTLGVGLIDQRIETLMSDRIATHYPMPDLERGWIHIEFERPLDGFSLGPLSDHKDGFFVTKGQFWYDAMDDYRSAHDEIMKRPVDPSPDPCWEPVWVPWVSRPGEWGTGRIEDVDESLMLDAGKTAKDLGLTTILNSGSYSFSSDQSGWAYPDECGDYVADPHKFKDFRKTADEFHRLGMRLCLWIDPFAVGKDSKAFATLKQMMIPDTTFLCPRNPDAQEHMANLMARALREYDADGYTVDCGGNVPLLPCTADHEHNSPSIGIALDQCYAKMKKAMDEVKPDAIIEFSHAYSNINCLNYASAFRATDSGDTGDFELDRRLCVLLRSFIPPGKAVHFDPLWWRLDEDDKTVSKMLSTAVFSGVPQIGADLVNIPESHRMLIKKWMGFYQDHKDDFRYGKMRPIQNDLQFSTVMITCPGKAFISYGNYFALKAPLGRGTKEAYLFNCSLNDFLHTILTDVEDEYSATVYDHMLTAVGENRLKAEGNEIHVDLTVPQGGYALLKKV